MGVVSEEYIMQRLSKFVNSEAGRKKIGEHRRGVYYGINKGGAGQLTKQKVNSILRKIRNEFISAVSTVIKSFRGNGVFFVVGDMDSNGYVKASICVSEDALRRESLHYMNDDLSIGHGEGVNDILALFAHGYTLSKRPYGFWVRDNASSESVGAMQRIGARMHRDPNPFLTNFVDKMNAEYNGQCVITLNDKYRAGGGG